VIIRDELRIAVVESTPYKNRIFSTALFAKVSQKDKINIGQHN